MKKTFAILLCLAMLLSCAALAEAPEKLYLATVNMNGAFDLQCSLP